jgi:YgiT-type zinc finger domain-containing protein
MQSRFCALTVFDTVAKSTGDAPGRGMNRYKPRYDYGRCHICGEQMKEKRINQVFWLKGKLIVIESVPAGVCPQCDEKIVKAEVGRQLATLIHNLKRLPKGKTITVPVVRYAKEVA